MEWTKLNDGAEYRASAPGVRYYLIRSNTNPSERRWGLFEQPAGCAEYLLDRCSTATEAMLRAETDAPFWRPPE